MISTWTKIEPARNCYRFYAISLANDLFNVYVVSCEWGRIGAKKYRRKVEVFNSVDEAMAQLKHEESLRIKHQYQLVLLRSILDCNHAFTSNSNQHLLD